MIAHPLTAVDLSTALLTALWLLVVLLAWRAAGRVYCDCCRSAFALFADHQCEHLCRRCWRHRRIDRARRSAR